MQKITISIVLALVVCASAYVPANEVDMTDVIDVLGRISKVDPKTIDKILKIESLTDEDKKDPKMAQLSRLLARTSKIDWGKVYQFSVEHQLTFGKQLTIDGNKVDMGEMFELLTRIAEINWAKFSSLFVATPSPPASPTKHGRLDMAKFKERIDELCSKQLNTFKVNVQSPSASSPIASSAKKKKNGRLDLAKLKERIDKLCFEELNKFAKTSK